MIYYFINFIVAITELYGVGFSIKYILCYGPSVISVIVTKRGHPRGGGLYGTSKTIRRGVS